MEVLSKGFTHPDTVERTLWLVERLAITFSDRFPSNNSVVMAILLVYAVQVNMEKRAFNERAVKFLKSCGTDAILSLSVISLYSSSL